MTDTNVNTESTKAQRLRRAAILLSSLPQSQQTAILKQMPIEKVRQLTDSITSLGSIDSTEKRNVFNEFHHDCGAQAVSQTSNNDSYFRTDAAHRTLNRPTEPQPENEKTESIPDSPDLLPLFLEIQEDLENEAQGGFDFLGSVPVKLAAQALELEDPQTVAIVLSRLSPDVAADLLTRFDLDWRLAIVRRLAKPIQTNRKNEKEILARIRQRLDLNAPLDEKKGGLFSIVKVLGKMEVTARQTLIDCLTVNDLSLAKKLSRQCIEFDDFAKLPDDEVKKLLTLLDTSLIAPAFSRCKHLTRHKLLKNMAEDAASLVKTEINDFLPRSKNEVDNAQKTILEKIFQMKNEGFLISEFSDLTESEDRQAA